MVTVVPAYGPQVGCEEEKEAYLMDLEGLIEEVLEDEKLLLIGGDLNGHVGRESNGYDGST